MRRRIRPRRAGENGAGPADRAAGFTLVELLVVIGIIAVLISILLPILVKAKLRAQQVVCASNMRQIALACLTYARDNKDTLPMPMGGYEDRLAGTRPPLEYTAIFMIDYGVVDYEQGVLWPYLDRSPSARQRVFNCPTDADPRMIDLGYATVNRNFSYAFNYQLNWGSGDPTVPGIRLYRVHYPEHKVLLAEPSSDSDSEGPIVTEFVRPRFAPDGSSEVLILLLTTRHSGLANEAFMDGHVEALDPHIFKLWPSSNGGVTPYSPTFRYYVDIFSDY